MTPALKTVAGIRYVSSNPAISFNSIHLANRQLSSGKELSEGGG